MMTPLPPRLFNNAVNRLISSVWGRFSPGVAAQPCDLVLFRLLGAGR